MAIGSSKPADGLRRGRLSAGFTFDRQLALALLVVALAPLALFGFVAFSRFSLAVRAEGDRGVIAAAVSARTLIDQMGTRLSTTAQSYGTWDTLIGYVDALDTDRIRTDVADFLVSRGTADVVSVVAGDDVSVSGGEAADATALAAVARGELAKGAGPGEIGPRLVSLPSGVHVASIWPIDLAGRSGTGAVAAEAGGSAIALARRLDGEFALDAARLTGFDVAVYGPAGRLEAASDAVMAAAAGSPAPGDGTGGIVVRDTGGVASGTLPLSDETGTPVGALVVAASLDALNAIDAELLPILGLTLALTAAGAAVLAILIARGLRRRLVAVQGGMAAVAGGDTSVRLAAGGRDELDRLAESHNRLAATLGRRDRELQEAVGAVEQLTPDRAVDDLVAAGLRAAVSVFGLESARVLDAEGRAIAERSRVGPAGGTGEEPGPGPWDATSGTGRPPAIRAPILVPPDHWVIEAIPAAGGEWTDGDSALFALYARQLGTAVRDAQLYAEAAARAAELARVNRLQGDFLRGVSHNLQTPLTHITVLAEDLRERPADEPDVRERAEIIRVEGERLAHLVAQLLTLSRLEAEVLAVQADPVALTPTVWRAWDALGSDRTLRVDDDSAGILAIGDRAAIEQVLWMLLDNALRYAPEGAITVGIRRADRARIASPGSAEAAIEVAVDDEGPGVPPEEREEIFGRFARGSTGADRSGTGLGLDVARGLIGAMGGTIRCEDAPGGGARFAFVLPAEEAGRPA